MAESLSLNTEYLGHPKGLYWLSASEAFERFSYYGMQSIIVLYMTHRLLLAGVVGDIWGFPNFRSILETVYGPLSVTALASAIFGIYAGLVWLTPIFGGMIADRWLGRTQTIIIGAALMTVGHALLTFTQPFLLALLSLLLGVGCVRGNLATQLGALYPPGDDRVTSAFQIYTLGVTLGVIAAPILCGTIGELDGWHWGFGAAGLGMGISLAIYLSGRHALAPEPRPAARQAVKRPPLTRDDWQAIILLLALIPVLAAASLGNQQIHNAYLIWGERHFHLALGGWRLPVTSLLAVDAVTSSGAVLLSFLFWRQYAKRRPEPSPLTKMTIGAALFALAPLIPAYLSARIAAGAPLAGILWALPFGLLNNFGWANLFPAALALYSKLAPRPIAGTMVGAFYLYAFLGNIAAGSLGGLIETWPGASFWLLHAACAALATLILFAVRLLAPQRIA